RLGCDSESWLLLTFWRRICALEASQRVATFRRTRNRLCHRPVSSTRKTDGLVSRSISEGGLSCPSTSVFALVLSESGAAKSFCLRGMYIFSGQWRHARKRRHFPGRKPGPPYKPDTVRWIHAGKCLSFAARHFRPHRNQIPVFCLRRVSLQLRTDVPSCCGILGAAPHVLSLTIRGLPPARIGARPSSST